MLEPTVPARTLTCVGTPSAPGTALCTRCYVRELVASCNGVANFGSSGILSCVCVAHADGVCATGPPPTLTYHSHTCLLRRVFAVLTLRRHLQLSVDWKPPYILSKVSPVLKSPTQTARTPAHTAAMSGSSSPRAMAWLTLEAAEYYHACVWLMLVVLVPSVRTYADTSPARTCALSSVRRAHSASLSPTAVC